MIFKTLCILLSGLLLVTSIGCQTGGAMRSPKKPTVEEQLLYFKKGDGVEITYFDLKGKKQKVTGVIKEITDEVIVMWGDPLKGTADVSVAFHRIHWIDFPQNKKDAEAEVKGAVKTVLAIAAIAGVILLAVYVISKNTDGEGDGGSWIDIFVGDRNPVTGL